MYIYWIDGDKKRGPITVPDFLSLLEMGEVNEETLCWHSGCSGWQKARELPALAAYFTDKKQGTEDETHAAPHAPGETSAGRGSSPSPTMQRIGVTLPRPGERLMARLTDCSIYAVLVLGCLYLFRVPYSPYLQPGSIFFWLPMTLLEAFCICRGRTTPGKAFFGIMLFIPTMNIPFRRAFFRSFLAMVMGMGCMQVWLAIFTLPLTFYSLKTRRITAWDFRSGILAVSVRKKRGGSLRVWTFIIILLVNLQLCSYFMQPWLPEMLRDLETYWPEAAQMLHEHLQEAATKQ